MAINQPQQGLNPQPTGAEEQAASKDAFSCFAQAFEAIIVNDPATITFAGSISKEMARKLWLWLTRDPAPWLVESISDGQSQNLPANAILDALLPRLIGDIKTWMTSLRAQEDGQRKITVQMGGGEVRDRYDAFMTILGARALIEQAASFGRAANHIASEEELSRSLKSLPLDNQAISAPLMHAAVGSVAVPGRLLVAAGHIAGGPSEAAIRGAGFGPLVDAMFAHAQSQVANLQAGAGAYADVDFICKSLDRFHKLHRAVGQYVEVERGSRWFEISAELTKRASAKLEPRLRDIPLDITQSLRAHRSGEDRADDMKLLEALNGMYLLAGARDARESLALNVLIDNLWNETGQSLDALTTRNLDLLRQAPANPIVLKRLEYAIKMGKLHFGADFAQGMAVAVEGIANRARA